MPVHGLLLVVMLLSAAPFTSVMKMPAPPLSCEFEIADGDIRHAIADPDPCDKRWKSRRR